MNNSLDCSCNGQTGGKNQVKTVNDAIMETKNNSRIKN